MGIKPDVVSYSAAISACGKGRQWKVALSLIKQMRSVGIKLNIVSYNASIQACASAGQPIKALEIFHEVQENATLDHITYNAILDAVCSSHPAKARELYCHGRSLYGAVEGIENGVPTLDLHDHSGGAGATAVAWWLTEQVPELTSEPDQLIIVTGWGKSRRETQYGNLRGRVEALLTELDVPTLPSHNQGRFVVDAQVWRSG